MLALPTISILLLKSQVLPVSSHNKLAFDPSTNIPEPFELASVCPTPTVISLSTTSKLFTVSVFMSPVIVKLPPIVTSPVVVIASI